MGEAFQAGPDDAMPEILISAFLERQQRTHEMRADGLAGHAVRNSSYSPEDSSVEKSGRKNPDGLGEGPSMRYGWLPG